MKKFALLFLVVAASGCPDIKVDPGETPSPKQPTVEFDPSNKIIPFPNNLLLDPATGKVALPAQCGETASTKAIREGVLNKLDGFGTFEGAMSVTFTEPYDKASVEANVVMYKRASGATVVDPATAVKVPIVVQVGTTTRFDADCKNPVEVVSATIIPRVPLDQKSTYVVALVDPDNNDDGVLDGVKTMDGMDSFTPSFTWSLVRQPENPVTIDDKGVVVADKTPLDPNDPVQLEQLKGINLLWNAHAKGLKFLKDTKNTKGTGIDPSTVLLAWEFNTQTTTDPLDPAVTTSPAAKILDGLLPGDVPLRSNISQTAGIDRTTPTSPFSQCPAGDNNTQCFLKISVGAGNYAVGNATCAALNCAAIGDVLGSRVGSKQYQIGTPNPYTGTETKMIPGPWPDAIAPTMFKSEDIDVLTAIPVSAPPAGGYPVVVFQHGLGQSKTNAIAIAGSLAGLGFATVAIDAVGHDSRAVRISSDAAKGCADVATSQRPDKGPSSVTSPQCYAPFLSSNLATTRDGIRQTVLDQLRLVAGLKACGTTACGTLQVDSAHIVYMGQSLGGIMGSMSVALSSDIKAAVLNVPGVGWADILENTQTVQIRCLLVDGLIDAGILTGAKCDFTVMPPTGLGTTDAWKAQPGYRQFALIGRWVLDPADPANFTRKLATKRFLIQKVEGDTVVPNIATNNEGALTGLTEAAADCAAAAPPALPPSAAITMNPMTTKFLKYVKFNPGDAMCPPGNTYTHGSLLSPANLNADGRLATARLQVDALTYLSINK